MRERHTQWKGRRDRSRKIIEMKRTKRSKGHTYKIFLEEK
jgi:hypothetical protein